MGKSQWAHQNKGLYPKRPKENQMELQSGKEGLVGSLPGTMEGFSELLSPIKMRPHIAAKRRQHLCRRGSDWSLSPSLDFSVLAPWCTCCRWCSQTEICKEADTKQSRSWRLFSDYKLSRRTTGGETDVCESMVGSSSLSTTIKTTLHLKAPSTRNGLWVPMHIHTHCPI